jgi:hypothetical protein
LHLANCLSLCIIYKSSPNAPSHPVSRELIILPCHQFDDVARSLMKKEREVVSQKRNQVDTRSNDRRNHENWVGADGSFLSSFSSLSSRSGAPLRRLPPAAPVFFRRSRARRLPPALSVLMRAKSPASISFSRARLWLSFQTRLPVLMRAKSHYILWCSGCCTRAAQRIQSYLPQLTKPCCACCVKSLNLSCT